MDGCGRNCCIFDRHLACAALIVSGRRSESPRYGCCRIPGDISERGLAWEWDWEWAWAIMPMMYAMNPTASLSPTDAAALGMQGRGNGHSGPTE